MISRLENGERAGRGIRKGLLLSFLLRYLTSKILPLSFIPASWAEQFAATEATTTRPNISQLSSIGIRRFTFISYIKFLD